MAALEVGLLAGFVVLVGCLFVLAMVEASLLHVRRSAVAAEAVGDDRDAKRLLRLLDDLPRVMNTVLLTVLLVQVSATAIAGVLAQRWVGGTAVTVTTVVVTVILFIYGEAIPKTIAIADPLRHARRYSRLVRVLVTVMSPVVAVLVRIASWQQPTEVDEVASGAVSEDELLHLTGEAAEAGQIEASDAELIEKSFTLGDLRIDEIVVPIADVVSVSVATPVAAALQTAIGAGHRRLIVQEGSPRRIVGFVRLRDLATPSTDAAAVVADVPILEALDVGRAEPAIDVLREMQQTRANLAVVRGEDGVALGIVTVEDIVEELLGEIDEPDPGER